MNKALIVGINKYQSSPLRGCINDVLLMYKVLSEKCGFETKNIDVITDGECTKSNILNKLHKLTHSVVPGDTIYFHFSGHGSQVVVNDWTDNDEADGRDEILCPVDLNWNDPLRDNELGVLFNQVPIGVNSLVVLDCCHSGTGLRNGDTITSRFLPPPISNVLFNPKIGLDDDLNFVFPEPDTKEIQTLKRDFMINTTKQHDTILISGCQDNQTSADAWIANKFHGALTYYMVQSLVESNFNITYTDLIVLVNQKMDKFNYSQNPQLEGKQELFNKLFLK